jgi:hypothetical protein
MLCDCLPSAHSCDPVASVVPTHCAAALIALSCCGGCWHGAQETLFIVKNAGLFKTEAGDIFQV